MPEPIMLDKVGLACITSELQAMLEGNGVKKSDAENICDMVEQYFEPKSRVTRILEKLICLTRR